MVRVSGPLRVVTDRPLLVSQVRVRAARDRAEQGGLTAAFDDSVPVVDGQLDMEVLPGPAVMILEVTGGFSHAVKLVVPDVETATLEQCVTAAEVAGDTDKRTLERLAGEVARDALDASDAARSAGDSATAAATSAQSAGVSAQSASGSASAAAQSASKAKTSETNADKSATAAGTSASQAASSASAAAGDAERVATIAGSTRWVGTQLEVNGELSPDLKGERGEPGRDGTMTFEELTPEQRESLKGEPGATTWAGIEDKPDVATQPELNVLRAEMVSRPAFFSGPGDPPATISGARVGDYWLNESTMELHKITGV